jgi:hypothetical protein
MLDYAASGDLLQASANPFAVLLQAHLRARETARDTPGRYRWKLELVKQLYDRGLSRDDVLQLFRFIDWVLALPAELERKFLTELEQWEEVRKMPYITSAERIGIEKGMQQGIQQGMQQGIQQGIQRGEATLLARQLERRFGPLPEWVRSRIEQADTPLLEAWGLRLLEVDSLERLFEPPTGR